MKKTFIANLLLLTASIVISLLAIEIFLRLTTRPTNIVTVMPNAKVAGTPTDYKLLHLPDGNTVEPVFQATPNGLSLRPNTRIKITNHVVSGRDVEFSVNSLGLRGPELPEKRPGDLRVLVLGDSITLADYLPYEFTYPAMLESYYNQIPPPDMKGRHLQFINAGVGTIDLATEYKILQEKYQAVKPDAVLIGMYLNDADHTPYINMQTKNWLVRNSYLFSLIYKSIKILEVSRGKSPYAVGERLDKKAAERFAKEHHLKPETLSQYLQPSNPAQYLRQLPNTSEEAFNYHIYARFWDWGYAWSDENWEEIRQVMIPLKRFCEKNHLALAVLLFPVSYQVYAAFEKNEPQQKFERLMNELDIPHLDLLPVLRKKFAADQRLIFFDHCHLTDEGYLFLTPQIADFLNEKIFQPSFPNPPERK